MTDGRDEKGKFAPGNPGGPGRPRRAVERDYLQTLSDVVKPEDWRRVVTQALQDAQSGDPRAREWLSRYLMGPEPAKLIDLAVSERRGVTSEDAVAAMVEEQEQREQLRFDFNLG